MPRRPMLALLAVPLLAVAACTAPTAQAAPQPPPATAVPAPSYWPGQEALMAAGETVDTTAPTRWPDAYAGVELDVPAGVLIVHRVPTASLDAAVRALVPQVTVRFADAVYSARQLGAWAEQVRADLPYWQRRGITIHEVGTRPGQCVTVGAADPARHASTIVARYRAMAVCVEQGHPAEPLTAD